MAIEVREVSVAYRSYRERPSSLKENLIKFLRTGTFRHYSTFDALHEVSFQVPRGTVLALVGSNGSGKSTLLKVLGQVLHPTHGSARLHGSISSLIELGAGFDPELTAVENIYLNGSLHKRTAKESAKHIDAILDFAEMREFADTPIKYYSSGMYARLGFSVAVDIDPDILLVDEILGVGDERFQEKCGRVFDQFIAAGKTIVLVSHDAKVIEQRATQAALLSRGRLVYLGDPHAAVAMYRDNSYETVLAHAGSATS